MNNIDYTELIQAIITLFAVLISSFLIPFLKEKLSKERYEKLKTWVSVAVKAAEQLYGSKTGKQKKEYVLAYLKEKGIAFDTKEIETLIESEVYKITQGGSWLSSEGTIKEGTPLEDVLNEAAEGIELEEPDTADAVG